MGKNAPGSDGQTGGAGGIGLASSITGTSTFYSGGAGGGANVTAGAGTPGLGGGGAGGASVGIAGTTNTGGGGGGSTNGGSGIVIVRYAGSQAATGGTITSANGYTIHTFTGDGTFTTGIYIIN